MAGKVRYLCLSLCIPKSCGVTRSVRQVITGFRRLQKPTHLSGARKKKITKWNGVPHEPQHMVGACSPLWCQITAEGRASASWTADGKRQHIMQVVRSLSGHSNKSARISVARPCPISLRLLMLLNLIWKLCIFCKLSFPKPFSKLHKLSAKPEGDLTTVLLFQACLRISITKLKEESNKSTSSWQGRSLGNSPLMLRLNSKLIHAW